MKRLLLIGLIFVLFSTPIARAAQPFTIDRVSTDSSGGQGSGDSYFVDISTDNSKMLFSSTSTNLVAGDSNNFSDVFVKNLETGTTTRVSTSSSGQEGNNHSAYMMPAQFNGDGRYVVFESVATNLVAGDTNNFRDIFMKDTQNGTLTRISTDSVNTQSNGDSFAPTISSNGRYVVFASQASNLVADDTNATYDIFMKDTQTGSTTRINTDSSGAEANGYTNYYPPQISGDGSHVVFTSNATNLVAGDTNNQGDVFRKNVTTGITQRVNTTSDGDQETYGSGNPAMSQDGRYVLFMTNSDELVAGDTNNDYDVYLKDMDTGAVELISSDDQGAIVNNYSDPSSYISNPISDDGRYVVFSSYGPDLLAPLSPTRLHMYVKDRHTQEISRLSKNSSGTDGNQDSGWSGMTMSFDGKIIGYSSGATNLVSGDTNGEDDIFLTSNPLFEVLGINVDNQDVSVVDNDSLADTGMNQTIILLVSVAVLAVGTFGLRKRAFKR